MKSVPFLAGLLVVLASLTRLAAEPVPHGDRPDRLVETRDDMSVEYSPGQEAWMEMAFVQMRTEASRPAFFPPAPATDAPAHPGSARDLRERRAALLAAVARQVGLPAATDLQGRTFDTFLGYYEMATELMRTLADEFPTATTARHLAIWQRDDLIARLRAGAAIEGMAYDAATDSGRFEFNRSFEGSTSHDRMSAIYAAIEQQRLKHTFNYDKDAFSASVTLNARPDPAGSKVPADSTSASGSMAARLVVPVIYRGGFSTPPDAAAFANVIPLLRAAVTAVAEQAATYSNASIVSIILHETAEIGLVENIITSPDRRWLCDGTANYVAWRVARDLLGADFATQVYSLDAQLRLHAASQPKIDLTRWSATEHQKEGEAETALNRAHYAFATRAMFLLTERHGEDALAQLWVDVSRTPKKNASAKTFANAYRKRFKSDLAKLVREAEQKPILAEALPAAPKP